jgi:membrane protease YdiL (CAAX protease family)
MSKKLTLAALSIYCIAVIVLLNLSSQTPGDYAKMLIKIKLRLSELQIKSILAFEDSLDQSILNEGKKQILSEIEETADQYSDFLWVQKEAAAIALVLKSPHVTMRLFPGFFDGSKEAEILIRIAVEPFMTPDPEILDAVEKGSFQSWLKNLILLEYFSKCNDQTRMAVQKDISENRIGLFRIRTFAMIGLMIAAILSGVYFMIFRRKFLVLINIPDKEEPDPDKGNRREKIENISLVMISWLAFFLTSGIMLPQIASFLLPEKISTGFLALINTTASGIFGIVMISWYFKNESLLFKQSPASDMFSLLSITVRKGLKGYFSLAGSGLMYYCISLPLVISVALVSQSFLENSRSLDNPIVTMILTAASPAELGILVFTVVAVGPVFEEIIFRGFLFSKLKTITNPERAAWISGILFGAAHLSLANLFPLCVLGYFLAVSFHNTRSLWGSIFLHSLWNLITTTFILYIFAG